MVDLKLYDLVVEAFRNATDNGDLEYLLSLGDKGITLDMLSYDSDIEGYGYFEVLKAVRQYLGKEQFS